MKKTVTEMLSKGSMELYGVVRMQRRLLCGIFGIICFVLLDHLLCHHHFSWGVLFALMAILLLLHHYWEFMVTLVLFVTSESMECFEFILDARFQLIIVTGLFIWLFLEGWEGRYWHKLDFVISSSLCCEMFDCYQWHMI